MFISERLVFLELQKTGGTHIRKLLDAYTDGSVQRKHDRVIDLPPDRFVFGSVRNPWDWYVSLWAYGVGGKGGVRDRTTRGVNLNYYYRFLPRTMGKHRPTLAEFFKSLLHDISKPVDSWKYVYADAEDVERFRLWLRMLLDSERRYDFGEGFAFSPVSEHAGLMTYRYLRQFTMGEGVYRDKRLASLEGTREFDAGNNICNGIVRNEFLEQDLVEVLQSSGHQLDEAQTAAILNKEGGKTNVSKRNPVSFYYDAETVELVRDKERFITEKYAYTSPVD